jgi:hypothetical protein
VLGTILRHFHVALAPGTSVWPLQRLTLRPRGGLPMVLARRAAADASAPSSQAADAECRVTSADVA